MGRCCEIDLSLKRVLPAQRAPLPGLGGGFISSERSNQSVPVEEWRWFQPRRGIQAAIKDTCT